ncbi:DNA polymerase III subunit beta [Longimicrobium sp.]|uniref:DNA polymerase III subunit beta n=1 Tax=Longimicrobium sp. TaxID=2029185 RepID=UPI002CC9DB6D|nr:DNA polymerase III subunit beta [Longimicrobium sp.]HSU16045.1 DNA polymerase III subunit beta [Longimicrobium sp.]
MRFTITRENLQQGLGAVAGSIPTRTTLPVLSNILIEAEDGAVRMSGTDLDTAVSVRVPAEVAEPGAITAPAKKLQEIARELPGATELSTQGDSILISSGRTRFKLNGLPRDEFPAFPKVDFGGSWRVTGAELQRLITHVSFAASTEETRPILNGVLWQLQDGEMRMVATNGHRLAKMTLPVEAGAEAPAADLIVHPRALQQVQRLFAGDAQVEVARSENHIGFRSETVQVYTRLIEGPYPNYEQVIPKDNDKFMVADKGALNSAIRRMAIVASDQTHRIRMSLGGPSLKFSVESPDLGAANEELEVEYDGDPLEIGFNAQYLLELLRYMPTDEVKMSFKAPERAATMQPLGNEDTPDYLCLVMPLRLLS